MRSLLVGLIGFLAIGGAAAVMQPAEAQPYGYGYRYGPPPPPVYRGYGYRRGYYPPPGYRSRGEYRRAYYPPRRCWTRPERVWTGWTWVTRPVRVCR